MALLRPRLTRVRVRAYRGYAWAKEGVLPRRWSWLEPEAAADFTRMIEACGDRLEFTDCFRSVMHQIKAIRKNPHKRRLYAPPTKSGHNWGWSLDLAVDESLENFRASGVNELVLAGRDRNALARWMRQFGFTGIRKERWHFNHLGDHETTVKKIEALYGPGFALSNHDVQSALNKLLGKRLTRPLVVDGVLGVKSNTAANMADRILFTDDRGAFSAQFRRVLAGATAEIEEV